RAQANHGVVRHQIIPPLAASKVSSENQRELAAQLPISAICRLHDIVVGGERQIDRQPADLEHAPCPATNRDSNMVPETCQLAVLRASSPLSRIARPDPAAGPARPCSAAQLASCAACSASISFFSSSGVNTGGATEIVSLSILPVKANGTP